MSRKRIALALVLLLSFSLNAENAERTLWRCTAFDAQNRDWIFESSFELTAINKAYEACKKQSNIPSSCKAAKEACELLVNGVTTRPMWRCVALDQMAEAWPSNIYRHRDDAALAAKAYCQDHSAFPDTCYINLITCKNLNARN